MSAEQGLTLLDFFAEARTLGSIPLWTTVFLAASGLFGMKRRFRRGSCRAFTLVAVLPAMASVLEVRYLLMTFRDHNGHYTPHQLDRFLSSGEAFVPLVVGCFCSCVLMFVASILWMRCKDEPGGN